MKKEVRAIEMFCDYDAEWPLWEIGMVTPQSLRLSPSLTRKLRVWTDYHLEHARPDQGWLVSNERDAEWSAEGERLSEHLAREMQGVASIKYTGI
ncbi:hypothetical protein [Marisediminicola sp. LYQ134]|uniref:hypothetical protein n=1 Tax=unclassified Marisediminicola TaxID=2618316 RepID=UPI0039839642